MMNRLLIVCCFLFLVTKVNAQENPPAQWGLDLGLKYSNINFSPTSVSTHGILGPTFGFFDNFNLANHFSLFYEISVASIGANNTFTVQNYNGFSSTPPITVTDEFREDEATLYLMPTYDFNENYFVSLGVFISGQLGARLTNENPGVNNTSDPLYALYTYQNENDLGVGYGISVGGGATFGHIRAWVNYDFDFANLINPGLISSPNAQTVYSKATLQYFRIAIAYSFID
jgi:hypothetical protein